MNESSTTSPDRRPYLHYVLFFVFLVISVTIGFLSTISYLEVRGEIVEAYEEVMDHTDEMIREVVVLVNREDTSRGRDYSTEIVAVLDAYLAGYTPPPDNASLPDTRPPEEHLHRLFGENAAVSVHITRITEVADVVRYSRARPPWEVRTNPDGSVTTSAYDLTPDGSYLLEAAVIIPQQGGIPAIYQQDIVAKARDVNPFLESVRVYDTAGDLVVDLTDPMNTTAGTLGPEMVQQVLTTRADIAVMDEETSRMTRYLFVDPDRETDENIRIVEVTYNLQDRIDHLNTVRLFNIITSLLGIIFGALVALASSWYITRPVDAIVEDVGIIARGDLDHRIRATKGIEFARLEESVNLMVRQLKETIKKLRESEEQVREYSKNLEEMVDRRAEQLEVANEEANLYIDILLHDINNANTVTLSYLEFLKESGLSEEQREYAGKALVGAQKSVEIIMNVGTIRKTYEKKTDLAPISLDRVIREEIAHYPDARIRYDGTDAVVIADNLFGEVFTNLIGNSLKHGGDGTEIRIAVADRGDKVEVSVEDTGPGIPDDLKGAVFERFRRGKTRASGKGLGLHICRSLVTWYGGTIRADDRVAGRPGEGAAIRFTLRKWV
ncbi:sensor histidine kinase [Methanofollis ethanolicus]|uniref:sensor histidine kinase n=1 Tax=Methanofollis ethanolicus TaxID=488124 RepID=UPI000833FDC3|nr:HAMP domain-containing sensor histidine kinase [Methanofollis ethanolicus]